MRTLSLVGLVAVILSLAGCMCLLPRTHPNHSSNGKQKPVEEEKVESHNSH
ncbi:hypothetical protein SAMN06269301_0821 [Geobacter sp. DSM 9736]|nr:hypothetical protein SAMN06269301_0821 [Geobacter sp. DSM 9736]